MTEADFSRQYHLTTNVSKYALREMLFQLTKKSINMKAIDKHKNQVRIIMFLSFKLKETKTRYYTTKREALAMIRELTEVK